MSIKFKWGTAGTKWLVFDDDYKWGTAGTKWLVFDDDYKWGTAGTKWLVFDDDYKLEISPISVGELPIIRRHAVKEEVTPGRCLCMVGKCPICSAFFEKRKPIRKIRV